MPASSRGANISGRIEKKKAATNKAQPSQKNRPNRIFGSDFGAGFSRESKAMGACSSRMFRPMVAIAQPTRFKIAKVFSFFVIQTSTSPIVTMPTPINSAGPKLSCVFGFSTVSNIGLMVIQNGLEG